MDEKKFKFIITHYMANGIAIAIETLNANNIYDEFTRENKSQDFIDGYNLAMYLLNHCKELMEETINE